jgi:hypothetical protein
MLTNVVLKEYPLYLSGIFSRSKYSSQMFPLRSPLQYRKYFSSSHMIRFNIIINVSIMSPSDTKAFVRVLVVVHLYRMTHGYIHPILIYIYKRRYIYICK